MSTLLLRGAAALSCALLLAFSRAQAGNSYDWKLPRGFPVPAVPADNPMNEAKVTLAASCLPTPACRAPAGIPARAVTHPNGRSPTACRARAALPEKPCHSTRRLF
jgi:hypothetical protein